MSTSLRNEPDDVCVSCRTALPRSAAYCPGCGRPTDAEDATVESVPTTYVAEPHWFGIAPAGVLLGLCGILAVAAVVLFALGRWPYGLIVAGAVGLLLVVFVEVAQRRPDGAVSRRSVEAMGDARARAGSLLESVAIRSRAQRQATVLRLELRRLQVRRRELLTAFGDAVYSGADAGMLRTQIEQLDERTIRIHSELQALAESANEEVAKARLVVQQTQMVSVPEPYPPPDEGTPPAPEPVPEPYPPPDEGTPPQPDPQPESRL